MLNIDNHTHEQYITDEKLPIRIHQQHFCLLKAAISLISTMKDKNARETQRVIHIVLSLIKIDVIAFLFFSSFDIERKHQKAIANNTAHWRGSMLLHLITLKASTPSF
jgi:uncharacterized YccA/Bax inhibitor family protein